MLDPVIGVVGAAGFIGRNLTEHLRHENRSVMQYTRSKPCIRRDGTVESTVESCSSVVWLASRINPLLAEEHPRLIVENAMALRETLEALHHLPKPLRFIYLSSGGTVYGEGSPPPFSEIDAPQPQTAYGRAKLAEERIVQDSGVDAVVVRIANAYGPGQRVASGQGVIAHWLRAARRSEPLHTFGDPETARDFVFVRDIAEGILTICDAKSPPTLINLGSGTPTTLAELARVVLEVVDNPSLRFEALPGRTFDLHSSWLSINLAERTLGWRPKTTLRKGISEAWDSVRATGDPL